MENGGEEDKRRRKRKRGARKGRVQLEGHVVRKMVVCTRWLDCLIIFLTHFQRGPPHLSLQGPDESGIEAEMMWVDVCLPTSRLWTPAEHCQVSLTERSLISYQALCWPLGGKEASGPCP